MTFLLRHKIDRDTKELYDVWVVGRCIGPSRIHPQTTDYAGSKVWCDETGPLSPNESDLFQSEVRHFPDDDDFFAEAESFEELRGMYLEYFL